MWYSVRINFRTSFAIIIYINDLPNASNLLNTNQPSVMNRKLSKISK